MHKWITDSMVYYLQKGTIIEVNVSDLGLVTP
jgi:hypothetical protein